MTILYNIRDNIIKYIQPLTELFFYEEYRKSNHINIRHHVLDLLRQKGYTNIKFVIDDCKKIDHMNPKQYLETKIKKLYNGKLSTKQTDDIISKLEFNKNDIIS